MSLAGNLKTVSFPDILQLLATGKKTGILEIKTSTRQKEVAFKSGNIIYASSVNSSEDLLGNMLLHRGRITKDELNRAIQMHKQTGRQLGTTLIDMNLFEKEEIGECLRLQIEEIVYNLFSWQSGDFYFHENEKPKKAPFLIELNTMNVIMEGTRRIDEWIEIQKVLPPDDVMLGLSPSPKTKNDEVRFSMEEFRVLALINGERTLADLMHISPLGEFVTCRAVYKLILNKLIEVVGKKESKEEIKIDEEEIILGIIFKLYNNCFYRIRQEVESIMGEDNALFNNFIAQYRNGIFTFFPGVDPNSDLGPSEEKFINAVHALPTQNRYHKLLSGLEYMLSEQLEFVFQLLGEGIYKHATGRVKKEISEPLALKRELVKRYSLDENFFKSLKRADKVVKMVRG
ncbi:MAG: DUF4388 domain-containing protein [Calditrichaeota bacterium]|nr:MAG: DUF4388 domain-containing protein [Calditrichota bacterium]